MPRIAWGAPIRASYTFPGVSSYQMTRVCFFGNKLSFRLSVVLAAAALLSASSLALGQSNSSPSVTIKVAKAGHKGYAHARRRASGHSSSSEALYQRHILGHLGQAIWDTPVYAEPHYGSHRYAMVRKGSYLVIRGAGVSGWFSVLLTNKTYGFMPVEDVNPLDYYVTDKALQSLKRSRERIKLARDPKWASRQRQPSRASDSWREGVSENPKGVARYEGCNGSGLEALPGLPRH
jgi:hypothetical protein